MTYSKVEAHTKIIKLVEDFRAHEATLEKAAEAQIENNFIRPLFRYLNWNTENEGLSHAHYEFKVQVTNRKGLRPDYILNLDGRDVLVMDAKQVKYSMKDPRWLYQVYSYAYSTQNSKPSEKIDFAILTDFQEFIVLDCTLFAAKPEAVNNFRVIDWKYTDYVDKFDELWELFERNHVMEDSRRGDLHGRPEGKDGGKPRPNNGLWSRYLSPQKVKANRIPPDKAFLAEMDDEKDGWRVLLAKDMKKLNPSADGDLITAAVQLLIDRLIFIKALSDREVDRDYLSEIKDRVTEAGLGAAQRDADWFSSCKTIFEELNNFYNGSIFAPRPELENVSVSNKVVQAVITDLQPENSPYNFAVLPVEILGTIYERFLGRVVRTTEKQVKIEEKPEVRKAGGVYYTPQYIVDYIVENTLGKLLEEKRPEGFDHDSVESRKPSGRSMTPADVAKIKVLDPSCGSGSFLLGAYGKLIEWHKDYFARAGREKRDRESFYRDESGQIRLTAKLKRDILKNNLFGVDIDPQAVEVTRFSLSLKALEDLREGELTEERTLFHQTVLPDLSQNIKNGNSLIGNDFSLIPMERVEAKSFDWKSEYKEIIENGGFDCIIGNPPYVNVFNLPAADVDYYSAKYKTFKNKYDLYGFFLERGIGLLRNDGLLGFITSRTWLTIDSFSKLREFLLKGGRVSKIILMPSKTFQNATVETAILLYIKDNYSTNQIENKIAVLECDGSQQTFVHKREIPQRIFLDSSSFSFNLTWDIGKGEIFTKIEKGSFSLGEVFSFSLGVKTSDNERFVLKEKKSKFDLPVFRGRDIFRYKIEPNGLWLHYDTDEIKKLHGARPRDPISFLRSEKIVLREISQQELIATLDEEQSLVLDTANVIFKSEDVIYSLKYVLALLNSKLINWWYSSHFKGLHVKLNQLSQLPIREIDFSNPAEKSQHEKMVALVSQMLELHESKAGAKTQAETDVYERQIKSVDEAIDGLVYELYGLSPEEIKIVEGKG